MTTCRLQENSCSLWAKWDVPSTRPEAQSHLNLRSPVGQAPVTREWRIIPERPWIMDDSLVKVCKSLFKPEAARKKLLSWVEIWLNIIYAAVDVCVQKYADGIDENINTNR